MKDLVDISSTGFNVVKKLAMGGIDYFENKKNEIMENFFTELFQGLIDEDIISYENEYIKPTREYCYKLLNAALIDEEKEKAIYYSRLYKYILNNQSIVKSKKLNLLKALKGLSFESIQLLPNFYVYQNYPTVHFSSLNEYINELIKDPDYSYDLNILSQFGILEKVQLVGKYTFKTNELFNELIKILFTEKDLNPELLNILIEEKKLLLLVEGICGEMVSYIDQIIMAKTKYKLVSKSYSEEDLELKKYKYIICMVEMMPITGDIIHKLKQENNILYIIITESHVHLLSKSKDKIYNLNSETPNDIQEFIQKIKK